MTILFIPASELKQQYAVLGHFYSLHFPGSEPVECRSVLEITARDSERDPVADAVFVMMNPGSSRPVKKRCQFVHAGCISEMQTELVSTVPDTTQYQLMRVMHYKCWQHVRVINLSDLRDPQSGSFTQRYAQLEIETGSAVHSMFSEERSAQLSCHLSRKLDGPIVCAWGVSNDLNLLIDRATKAMRSEQGVTGLAKPGQAGKYFHPLPLLQPQKEQWVMQMLGQLNA